VADGRARDLVIDTDVDAVLAVVKRARARL